MKPDPEQFLQTLSDSGILSPYDISTLTAKLTGAGQATTPEALADELVRQGKLTEYQSREAVKGKVEGLVLGQYTLLEEIGRGGMGVVYKARHRRMERLVALKVLPRSATDSETKVRRFHREIKAVARLSHNNIVIAFDADEQDGTHYLAMEYMKGIDLSAYVKGRGALPLGEAVDYVLQAARGLACAHDHGIVHRDVKPANLLLGTDGTVKLLDLGLAQLGGGEADQQTLTIEGQIMGTAAFMAPEQLEDAKSADHRADIYSLGCVLYRLATGELPYEGDTAMRMALAHREKPIPRLGDKCRDVPKRLEDIYQRMMAKKLEDRFQSMEEVVEGLEKLIEDGVVPATDMHDSTGRAKPRGTGTTTVSTARPRKHALLIGSGIGIAAIIGLAVVLIQVLWPGTPPPPTVPMAAKPPTGDTITPEDGWVDLLDSVDLTTHTLGGQWRRTERGLEGVRADHGSTYELALKLPIRLAGSFELIADVTRKSDHRTAFVLPVGRTRASVMLSRARCGIHRVDGKHIAPAREPSSNPTVTDTADIRAGRHKVRLVVQATGDQRCSIAADVDDKNIISFEGDQSRISIGPHYTDHPDAVIIDHDDQGLILHRITFRMLSGEAKLLRGGKSATVDAQPPLGDTITPDDGWTDVLRAVELPDDTVAGRWQAVDSGFRVNSPQGRLRVPVRPGGNYQLKATFQRQKGTGTIGYLLPVGDRHVNLFFHHKGESHVLRDVAGVDINRLEGVVTAPIRKFNLFEPHDTLIDVSTSGADAQVSVELDGKKILHWTGKTADLSPGSGGGVAWPTDGTFVLGCGSNQGIDFQEVQLRMLSGEAKLLGASKNPNYALEFDGKRSYVAIPRLDRGTAKAITVEGVVTPFNADGSRQCLPNALGVGFSVHEEGGTLRWKAQAPVQRNPVGHLNVIADDGVSPGLRRHVAAVWDGKHLSLFVGGQLKARSPLDSIAPPSEHEQGTLPLGAGHGVFQGIEGAKAYCWPGLIDEVRISNIARYEQNFTPQERFEPDENTLALYHFDEGEGDILKDSSGNNHHGKIHNAKWVRAEDQQASSADRINLTRGLVAHWNFDDGEGLTARDSSGNGHHGTLKNMDAKTAWVKDDLPKIEGNKGALRFDGEDGFVDNGLVGNLGSRLEKGSLSFWMNAGEPNAVESEWLPLAGR